jgi:hypothetical protein
VLLDPPDLSLGALLTLRVAASWRSLQRQGAGNSNVCGPATVLHRETGTIHDDATDEAIDCTQGGCNGADTGQNGYGDNLDCTKIIQGPENTVISLDFTHIALESGGACGGANGGVGCDVVTVYDGPDTTSAVLGTFSGTTVPERIQSTGNSMTVRFQTDTGNYALSQAGVTDDPGFYADCASSRSA